MRIDTLTTYILGNGEGAVTPKRVQQASPVGALTPSELDLKQESQATTAHIISFLEEKKKKKKKQGCNLIRKYDAHDAGTKGLIVNITG